MRWAVARQFGLDRGCGSRFNLAKLRGELKLLSRRLEPVKIEQLPYGEIIRCHDRADALFYLDPPYNETARNGVAFDRSDYVAMAEQLSAIAGNFIMSINDTPFIRSTFAAFEIEGVLTTWTIGTKMTGAGAKVTELIIRNRR